MPNQAMIKSAVTDVADDSQQDISQQNLSQINQSQDGQFQDGDSQDSNSQDGKSQDGQSQGGGSQDGQSQDGGSNEGDVQSAHSQEQSQDPVSLDPRILPKAGAEDDSSLSEVSNQSFNAFNPNRRWKMNPQAPPSAQPPRNTTSEGQMITGDSSVSTGRVAMPANTAAVRKEVQLKDLSELANKCKWFFSTLFLAL